MLANLTAVKQSLGITKTSDDETLKAIIGGVSAFVEGYCNRTFAASERTEYHIGGEHDLFLKSAPVNSVTSIHTNIGTQASPVWDAVSAQEYTIHTDEGIIEHDSVFPSGSKNIRVIYNAGYATIPADIRLLVVELSVKAYMRRKSQGKSSESLGSARIDWESTLTEEQKSTLGRYRFVNV